MKNIRTVCFDLDDTLWDLSPVIPRAEDRLYAWFGDYYPRVVEAYTAEDIKALREAATRRWPEQRHNLTELRLRILRIIANTAGYDEQMVQGAYEVFLAARNDVTLYDDVIPVLERLAESYKLVALSNGNADLKRIGIAGYFSEIYSARDIGVAKPDRRFFAEASLRCGVAAATMLHVGDHPENDIAAAQEVGMVTVWLNRNAQVWPLDSCHPDYEISGLHDLVSLLR
jgi:putative hydrolase of the HAD superfamily